MAAAPLRYLLAGRARGAACSELDELTAHTVPIVREPAVKRPDTADLVEDRIDGAYIAVFHARFVSAAPRVAERIGTVQYQPIPAPSREIRMSVHVSHVFPFVSTDTA